MVRSLTGQHPADVTKVLGSLRDRGLLEMIGGRRSARYQLGPAATLGPLFASAAQQMASATPGPTVTSDSLPLNLGGSEVSFGRLASNPGGLVSNSEDIWEDLRAMSEVARHQRHLDVATRDDLIVRLCTPVPLSPAELSQLLGRGEEYLRKVLRSLVVTGRLAFLYPERPSHPRQRYVAVLRDKREEPILAADPAQGDGTQR